MTRGGVMTRRGIMTHGSVMTRRGIALCGGVLVGACVVIGRARLARINLGATTVVALPGKRLMPGNDRPFSAVKGALGGVLYLELHGGVWVTRRILRIRRAAAAGTGNEEEDGNCDGDPGFHSNTSCAAVANSPTQRR
jgi:hypothetical protein